MCGVNFALASKIYRVLFLQVVRMASWNFCQSEFGILWNRSSQL